MTDTVLVVDFGAQYARLIARRVREAHVYSEIVPSSITVDEIRARAPKGIIFSGGPKSVYETPAPTIDPGIYELGIPILGLCYGAQLMALQLGGTVSRTGQGEYGRTSLSLAGQRRRLFPDWPATSSVWMSHGDAITEVPAGFVATANSAGRAGRRHARRRTPTVRAAVPPRGGAHRPGQRGVRPLPDRRLRVRAGVDARVDHRAAGGRGAGAGGRRSCAVRAVGRRRLGRGGRAGAQGGGRRSSPACSSTPA